MELFMLGKQFVICMLVFLATIPTLGQGKKTISSKGISSITVQEYFVEEGMDEPVVESIEKFNEEGELTEVQEFNKKGDVRKWEKYAFDRDGNLVEETFLDGDGKVVRTEKSIYREGLRIEKEFYNEKGRLYKRKVYQYEYR